MVQQYNDGARAPLLVPQLPSSDNPRWMSPSGGYVDSIILDMRGELNISAVSLVTAPLGDRARAGVRDFRIDLATTRGERRTVSRNRPVLTQTPHANASRLTDGVLDEAAGPCPVFHNTSNEHAAWVAIELGDAPVAMDFIRLHFVPGVGGLDFSLRVGNTTEIADTRPCAPRRGWDWHLPSTRDRDGPYFRPWATYGCPGEARYVFVEQGHNYAFPVQLCEVEVGPGNDAEVWGGVGGEAPSLCLLERRSHTHTHTHTLSLLLSPLFLSAGGGNLGLRLDRGSPRCGSAVHKGQLAGAGGHSSLQRRCRAGRFRPLRSVGAVLARV